ncbi:MAG: BrnT family toxin, partial [Polaromonas sp.]
KDYGERRFRVPGCINGRLHAAVSTPRADKLHVISLRKANSREVKIYEKTLES